MSGAGRGSTDRQATPPNAAAPVAHEPDNATLSADRGSWAEAIPRRSSGCPAVVSTGRRSARNTKELRCHRSLDNFAEIITLPAGMADRFATTLDCDG